MTESIDIYVILGTLLGIATISLALRLYVRRFMTIRRFELDDYLMISAWGCMATSVIIQCELVYHHVLDFSEATQEELKLDFRFFFAIPIIYLVNLWLIKFALLAFYNRIFAQPALKNLIFWTGIYLILSMIGAILTQILYCEPVSAAFDPTKFVTVCSPISKIENYVFVVLIVTTDLLVMYIPLKTLRKLRINTNKKLSLALLFTLGIFATISSIVRAVIVITGTGDIGKAFIWATIEELVCFVVANAPILRPLLFRGKSFESSGTSQHTHGTGLQTGTFHDTYEMTPKETGVVSVVSTGDAKKRETNVPPENRIDILRTVEVRVQSSRGGSQDTSVSSFV